MLQGQRLDGLDARDAGRYEVVQIIG